jgi:hypothetical protein
MAIIACVTSVILLQACVYVPPVWDGSDAINLLQTIEEGITTKAEVLEQLGEPSYRNEDQRKFTYSGHKSGGFIAIGSIGMAGAGLIDEEPWWVEIQFDDNDVVVSLKSSEVTTASDSEVCNFAISTKDGAVSWEAAAAWRSYVKEAKRRGLTPEQCALQLLADEEARAREIAECETAISEVVNLDRDSLLALKAECETALGPEKRWMWTCLFAHQGDLRSQYNLGKSYHYGQAPGGADLSKALLWYTLANSSGYREPEYQHCYYKADIGYTCDEPTDLLSEVRLQLSDESIAKVNEFVTDWQPNPEECEVGSVQFEN